MEPPARTHAALVTLNGAAVVFSLIWLLGHMTVRLWDWEFWFAAGYLALCSINFAYLRRGGAAGGRA